MVAGCGGHLRLRLYENPSQSQVSTTPNSLFQKLRACSSEVSYLLPLVLLDTLIISAQQGINKCIDCLLYARGIIFSQQKRSE